METFGNQIAQLLSSKKFLVTLATVLGIALGYLPPEALYAGGAYVVGQGIADNGKEAARINSKKPTAPTT